MEKTFLYFLCDNGGICNLELPILLSKNTIFTHEFGQYKVENFELMEDGELIVNCERITMDITTETMEALIRKSIKKR